MTVRDARDIVLRHFGPVDIKCPNCKEFVRTECEHPRPPYFQCALFCLTCLYWPFGLAYWLWGPIDSIHYCPKCKKEAGKTGGY